MKKKLNCILLVDDDKFCNFFHDRVLGKMNCTESIEIVTDGVMALEFLKSRKNKPDIIFLDINMPKMNGWEFLEEYKKLPEDEQAKVVRVMLPSPLNPDDTARAENHGSVSGYNTKYLTTDAVDQILLQYFPDYF